MHIVAEWVLEVKQTLRVYFAFCGAERAPSPTACNGGSVLSSMLLPRGEEIRYSFALGNVA